MRTVLVAAGVAMAAASALAPAAPRQHTETPGDLARGRAEGIAVSSSGRLSLAPRLSRLGRVDGAQAWSLAAGGGVFVGTGPDGRIWRAFPPAAPEPFATIAEPLVTALVVAPDGEVVAGSAPAGLVYRIRPDGRATVWAETGERYVWALAYIADGRLFAGTGDRGRIQELLASGSTEDFFDTGDTHVVSLVALPGGDLLAGGAGRGIVYRVDPEGHAIVLHDDELPEVSALAAAGDGSVYAAVMAGPAAETRRPAVRLRLPDGTEIGRVDESLGPLEESSGPTVHGVIEGLAPTPSESAPRLRGRVVRLGPDGELAELWRSVTEAPFCLALDGAGRLYIGTGEPARLYRVERDGDVALLATLDEAQAARLQWADGGLYLATSNPAALYRLDEEPAEVGSFLSHPFDAGATARWGAIRWSTTGEPGHTEIYTRTGNSAQADPTWSGWSPALADPGVSAIVNPDGRYLQWRVRQTAAAGAQEELSAVTFHFEMENRLPRIDAFDAERPSAPSGPWRLGWKTSDPDGDPLDVEIAYRRAGGGEEWLGAGRQAVAASAPGESVPGSLDWDTAALDEGRYTVRAAVSDQPGHPPGAGRSAHPPDIEVVVDRTPPRVEWTAGPGGLLEVQVEDDDSTVRSLELWCAGRLRSTARPVDGVADSRSERYRFERPADPALGWSLRGVDVAGNAGEIALDGD